jgi:hypothetical protein
MFAIEVDALVSMKGMQLDFVGGDTGKFKLTYLDIPVLAWVNLAPTPTARVHLLRGTIIQLQVEREVRAGGRRLRKGSNSRRNRASD